MDFHGDLAKSSASKLLPFRTQAPRQADSLPHFDAGLGQSPHEISMLRRPVPVEARQAPQLEEQDGLAHDARNLLTSLELLAGLLGEPGVLSEEHKHLAGDLKSLGGPLATLVERMADAGRRPVSAGSTRREPVFVREPLRPSLATLKMTSAAARAVARGPQTRQQADAGTMVKSCERLLNAVAGPSVTVHVSHERGLGELAMSGEDVTRVLMNLVKNASEAMPRGGRVTITVRRALGAQPNVLLVVQDTGVGIPAHAMGQVFQAGFSSKKADAKWPGTTYRGLGLTIVRDLVEAAGGCIRVVSTLNKGATFEIKLPCIKA